MLWIAETNDAGDATDEPPWSNQQVDGVLEEGGLISFNCVSDKLAYPTDDKQRERPAPVEKEQRPRHGNHRYADGVQ